MQSNNISSIPFDQVSRTPATMSQPVITYSLPGIVSGVATSMESLMVSGVLQSHIVSPQSTVDTQSRTPMSVCDNDGGYNVLKRAEPISNYSDNQLLNQPILPCVISTTGTVSAFPQTNNNLMISSSKVADKHYKKKSKTRYKCLYHLKLLNIKEAINKGDTILTFEVVVAMSQSIYTCTLNNNISTIDVSNVVGEHSQNFSDLRKKDLLESLVKTIHILCKHLREDIKSIPLNENYVFHPFVQNFGLVKVSDYVAYVNASLDSDVVQFVAAQDGNVSQQQQNNSHYSHTQSKPLSRNESSENISLSMHNLSATKSGHLMNSLNGKDLISFVDYPNNSTVTTVEANRTVSKLVFEDESHPYTIISSKCSCQLSDSCLKVPEYLFSTIKQAVDSLQNLHCKGLIILSQSNDPLKRKFRFLEVPSDHIFVGLPCADSFYSIIKGQKDEDFIIARDYMDPGNASKKCVFQKPLHGGALLDSCGNISIIEKPCLVIPPNSSTRSQKTEIKELPMELVYSKNHPLDCDEIVSVLKSLTQSHGSTENNKDELFDSPVLLDSMIPATFKPSSHIDRSEKVTESQRRRSSDDHLISKRQPQPEIQVERIFCQYVSVPTPVARDDDWSKQQLRGRKSSNEHLDSMTAIRGRAASAMPHLNDGVDVMQPLPPGLQKPMPNSQIGLQNPPKPLINPVQRLPNPAQFLVTNKANNRGPVGGNLFLQGVANAPHHIIGNQGPGSTHAVSQNGTKCPMTINNVPKVLPSQVVIAPGITQGQMPDLHQMSLSLANIGLSLAPPPHQAQLMPGAVHPAPALTPHSMVEGAVHEHQTFPGHSSRQLAYMNNALRQQQLQDPNLINTLMANNNFWNPPAPLVPQTSVSVPIVQSNTIASIAHTPTRPLHPELIATPQSLDPLKACTPPSDIDSKPKADQTIGRFVIRPVTETVANNS